MNFLDTIPTSYLGWIATFLFTVCYIPQIRKLIKSKSIDGVSAWFFALQFVANIVAMDYAIRLSQGPLEVKYALGLFFVGVVLVVYFLHGDD